MEPGSLAQEDRRHWPGDTRDTGKWDPWPGVIPWLAGCSPVSGGDRGRQNTDSALRKWQTVSVAVMALPFIRACINPRGTIDATRSQARWGLPAGPREPPLLGQPGAALSPSRGDSAGTVWRPKPPNPEGRARCLCGFTSNVSGPPLEPCALSSRKTNNFNSHLNH